jgi:hypothetical protein
MASFVDAGSADSLDPSCLSRIEREAFVLKLPDPEVELSQSDLDRFVGSYSGADGLTYRVERVGKRLRAVVNGEPPVLLLPTSPTHFRLAGHEKNGARFELTDGKTTGMILEYGDYAGVD